MFRCSTLAILTLSYQMFWNLKSGNAIPTQKPHHVQNPTQKTIHLSFVSLTPGWSSQMTRFSGTLIVQFAIMSPQTASSASSWRGGEWDSWTISSLTLSLCCLTLMVLMVTRLGSLKNVSMVRFGIHSPGSVEMSFAERKGVSL